MEIAQRITKQTTPEQAVIEEEAKKVRLEKRLERESRRLLNEIAREAGSTFAASGQLLNADEFTDEWRTLLRQHYRRVAPAFSKQLRREINANRENFSAETLNVVNSDETQANVQNALIAAFAARTALSSRSLVSTTQNDLTRSLTNAIAQTVGEVPPGRAVTNRAIGASLRRNFQKTSAGRPTTISMSETGFAAEKSKSIESQVIESETNGNVQVVKMWITVGDERVRPQQGGVFNHVDADRQIQNENDPFVVTGELLMFPTDTSLGASLGNVINCRCIANRFAQEVDPF